MLGSVTGRISSGPKKLLLQKRNKIEPKPADPGSPENGSLGLSTGLATQWL